MNVLGLWSCIVSAALTAGTALTAPVIAAPASEVVSIDSGKVEGVVNGEVLSFKGIPFAKPPVGSLRWRPPQPVEAWTGVFKADSHGHDCMQNPFPGDAAPLGTPPAEDCLVINVWRPADAGDDADLPVMVWIYGGGFVNGGSSPDVYDGSAFAEKGVIMVSFNYRVGRFGFFAHPALTAEARALGEPVGNYGYMDQLAAFEWVQRNIAAFGGDPENVTIFGESAGGGSVMNWLVSGPAQGLFHKAVVQSGGGRSSLMGGRGLTTPGPQGQPSAEQTGLNLAEKHGIEGTGAEALAAMRALPAETVLDGLNMASMGQAGDTYAGVIADGTIVPPNQQQLLLDGAHARVPVMIGANSADIGFSFAQNMDQVLAPFGEDGEAALAAYDPDGTGDFRAVGTAVAMDQMMTEPARFVAATMAAQGLPAYHYRFSYVASSMRDEWAGAPHATEIPYVFDTVKAKYGDELTSTDAAIADVANRYWVNFARTGDPNAPDLPDWPAYSRESDVIMNFTAEGDAEAMADPWKTRLDLIERHR